MRENIMLIDGVRHRETPFAYCCAEGGGSVEGCDCVNRNHGTAWTVYPEAEGVFAIRVVTHDEEAEPEIEKIRAAGRGACLCPLSTIERVIVDHGTCGRGGCPYGGDV